MQSMSDFHYIDSSEQEYADMPIRIEQTRKLTDEEIIGRALDEYRAEGWKQLVVEPEAKQIDQNLRKRHDNYEYLMRRMEIDKKYEQILQEKSQKVRDANINKRKVLERHKLAATVTEKRNDLAKYLISKNQKEDLLVRHLRKEVKKIEFSKAVQNQKDLKDKIRALKQKRRHQMASKYNKKVGQIEQLRQQLEELRENKRRNKAEVDRAIEKLGKKVQEQREGISRKVQGSSEWRV